MITTLKRAAIASALMVSLAMPALAQNTNSATNTNSSTNTNSALNTNSTTNTNGKHDRDDDDKEKKGKKEKEAKKELNAACMQSAVEKRDSTLITALDKYAAAAKAALSTRKDALKAAWAKTDRKERREALRAAWKGYKESLSKARREFRTSRLDAWKEYVKGRKDCGTHGSSDDPSTAGADAQL